VRKRILRETGLRIARRATPILVPFVLALLSVFHTDSTTFAQQDASKTTKPSPAIRSLYTRLTKCKLIYFKQEGGQSAELCSGVAGYKLRVETDDERMSITVVDEKNRRNPLDFWSLITFHFSSLGEKAEWRVVKRGEKVVPIALIVRVNSYEPPDSGRVVSYLTVAKITKDEICVTDKIPPGPDANLEARRAADTSAGKPCLRRPEEPRQDTQ
jgi:hypothetical protein